MKKIFIILFVISLFSQVPAQFKYGIEAGLNISTIKGNDPHKINGTAGIITGINGQYELIDFLSVGTGLYLSQKGVKRSLYDNIQGVENFNYLEIPFNLLITPPIKQAGKTTILAGFYIARLLSATTTPDNQGLTSPVNVDDMMRASDYGLNFGIYQGFHLISGMLNIGIKYSLGLESLDKPYDLFKYGEEFKSDGIYKLNNSVIAFTAGYTF